MDCYDQRWCPDGECDLCDFWMERGVSRREARWMRFRRFFVRLWRRDFRAGYVNLAPPLRGREGDDAVTWTEQLEAALMAEIALLRRWARESREGGWSTHQVQPMLDRANALALVLCDAAPPSPVTDGANNEGKEG